MKHLVLFALGLLLMTAFESVTALPSLNFWPFNIAKKHRPYGKTDKVIIKEIFKEMGSNSLTEPRLYNMDIDTLDKLYSAMVVYKEFGKFITNEDGLDAEGKKDFKKVLTERIREDYKVCPVREYCESELPDPVKTDILTMIQDACGEKGLLPHPTDMVSLLGNFAISKRKELIENVRKIGSAQKVVEEFKQELKKKGVSMLIDVVNSRTPAEINSYEEKTDDDIEKEILKEMGPNPSNPALETLYGAMVVYKQFGKFIANEYSGQKEDFKKELIRRIGHNKEPCPSVVRNYLKEGLELSDEELKNDILEMIENACPKEAEQPDRESMSSDLGSFAYKKKNALIEKVRKTSDPKTVVQELKEELKKKGVSILMTVIQ